MAGRLSSILPPSGEKPLPSMPPDSTSSRSSGRASPSDSARSSSPGANRLRKVARAPSYARSRSSQVIASNKEPSVPSLHELQQDAALSPMLPPPPITGGAYNSRSSSLDRSRPNTPNSHSRPTTPSLQVPGQPSATPLSSGGTHDKHRKKNSWFGGRPKREEEPQGPAAWIGGHPQKLSYDTDNLLKAKPVQELWDDADGNCHVYLSSRNSGKSASFKVDSAIFASSAVLTRLAFGDVPSHPPLAEKRQPPLDARTQSFYLSDPDTPPATPKRPVGSSSSTSSHDDSRGRRSHLSHMSDCAREEAHLYIPLKLGADVPKASAIATPQNKPKPDGLEKADPAADDLQTLVDIRNFFAFLCGQSLIATERRGSMFQIFMSIAGILKTYEFSNLDGSTFGEVPSSSFDNYVAELNLADVRMSREKTIEGVVLGERMKSVLLYNEAFTHAVGKHEELVNMKSPKFNLISAITQNRLIRAAMDLEKRTASIQLILTDFDFTSLFNGIMNSKTSEERKEGVRFDEWKDAFLGMRKWTMNSYQHRYGHWPPKAKSKKNNLETSGLNRLVLQDVYHDMSTMYDLLVDRSNLTTRTVDGVSLTQGAKEEPTIRALRAVLSEYDRSSPPVKPPIPFDLPKLPDLRTTRPDFGTGDKKKDLKAIGKKLKEEELTQLFRATWNEDITMTPFLEAYKEMERRAARGCTIAETVDLRVGQWIFMYVVLQALPMLACDAPGIKHTKGVEYFLCEPPRSGVPWANSSTAAGAGGVSRRWFSVGGEGGGVVSLPSDVVEHGVEGIYHRSHCWEMAERWSANNPILNSALHEQEAINASQAAALGDGLPTPDGPGGLISPGGIPGGRSMSPAFTMNRVSSLGLGLEALPLPAGITPDGRPPSVGPGGRPGSRGGQQHAVDASKTFDAILADVGTQKKGKKK